MRSHEEPGLLEAGYGTNSAGFTIKSYGELMKETSFTSTKVLEEMYQLNCPLAHEDITSFNVSIPHPVLVSFFWFARGLCIWLVYLTCCRVFTQSYYPKSSLLKAEIAEMMPLQIFGRVRALSTDLGFMVMGFD